MTVLPGLRPPALKTSPLPLAELLAAAFCFALLPGTAGAAVLDSGGEVDDALSDSAIVPVPPAGEADKPGVVPVSKQGAASGNTQAGAVAESHDAQTVEEAERRRNDSEGWMGYQRAPIRWSGSLGLDYLRTTGSSAFRETLNLGGDSFIIAPYIAEVGGSMFFTRSQVTSEQRGTANSLNGSGFLSLFGQSRWPTRIVLTGGDSESAQGGDTSGTTMRGITVDQSYRPEDNSYALSGQVGRATFSSTQGDLTVTQNRQLTYSPTLKTEMPQTFNASGSYVGFNRRNADGVVTGLTTRQLVATHTINMEEWNGFRFDTSLSHTGIKDSASNAEARGSDFSQVTSSYSWLPEDVDSLMTVGGALSATRFTNSVGASESSSETYVGSVSVNHPLSARFQSSYGYQAFINAGGGLRRFGQSANTALSYSSVGMALGDYFYSWGGGGGASISKTSDAGATGSLAVSAQHSLSRAFPPEGASGQRTLSVSQSLSRTTLSGQLAGDTTSLTTSGNYTWSGAAFGETPLTSSLSADDRRTSGIGASWSQSVRSTVNANRPLSWHETFSLSGSVDFIRQANKESEAEQDTAWIGTGFMAMTYVNQRLWKVPRLIGRVEYRLLASPSSPSAGEGNSLVFDHALTSELNYRIGRLRFRGVANVFWTGRGQPAHSLQLSINRDFGGTL